MWASAPTHKGSYFALKVGSCVGRDALSAAVSDEGALRMRHTPCGCIPPQSAVADGKRVSYTVQFLDIALPTAGRRGRRPLQYVERSIYVCRGRRPRRPVAGTFVIAKTSVAAVGALIERPSPRPQAHVAIWFAVKIKVPALAGEARCPCRARTQSLSQLR